MAKNALLELTERPAKARSDRCILYIWMCCASDLATRRRNSSFPSRTAFKRFAMGNNKIELFLERMRFWRGTGRGHGTGITKSNGNVHKIPPRRVPSNGYTGPITLSSYQRFQMDPRGAREGEKEGVHIALPIGDHLSTATVVPTRRLNIMFTELPTSQGTLSNLSSFEVAAALKIVNYKFSLDGG